jgi:hypothetical protein
MKKRLAILLLLPLAACHPKLPPTTPPIVQNPLPCQHHLAPTDLETDIDDAPNRRTRARLEENLKEISADQNRLDLVLRFIEENSKLKIIVNWQTLATENVTPATPITLHLREVPLRKSLNTLLKTVIPETVPDANLSYTIRHGIIYISTRDHLNSPTFRAERSYDVTDLLAKRGHIPHNDYAQVLIDTITTTVAPETWTAHGGTTGTIREQNNHLIIRQTYDNHTALKQLFEELRPRTPESFYRD